MQLKLKQQESNKKENAAKTKATRKKMQLKLKQQESNKKKKQQERKCS